MRTHPLSTHKIKSSVVVLLALVVGLLPIVVQAQGKLDVRLNIVESQPNADEVVNRVHAQISVVDEKGAPVQGLATEAFKAFEDSAPVQLLSVGPAQGPISLVLAIDVSGSMSYADKAGKVPIDELKRAVKSLIESLQPEDEVALITFGSDVNLLMDFSYDHNAVINAMEQVSAEGWTCLYDGVYRAVEKAALKPMGRRAVVAFSDGFDEGADDKPCSVHTLAEVIAKASNETLQVPIYTVGLESKNVARDDLAKMAVDTGGRNIITPDAAALTELFGVLAMQMKSQYELVYRSVAPAGVHQLVVQVTAGQVTGDSQVKSFGVLPVPPRPRIVNPKDGQTLKEASTVSIETLAQCALSSIQVYVDDTLLQSLSEDKRSLSVPFDPTQYTEGSHRLRVVVVDCNGQAGETTTNIGIGIEITPVPTQPGASAGFTPVVGQLETPAPANTPAPTPTPCPWYSVDECNENRDYLLYGGAGLLVVIIIVVLVTVLRKKRTPATPEPAASMWGANVPGAPEPAPAWAPPAVESKAPAAWGGSEAATEDAAEAAEDVTRDVAPMGGVVATLTVRKSLELASNTVFELQSREYRIGRSQSPEFHNDLVIPDSPVSRVHATLTYQNGAFVLRDADSKFGCKVNGVPVGPQGVTLNDGDEVMLGTQTVLDYRRLAPAASEELTEDVNDLDSTADAQDADGTQEAGRDPERTA